MFGASIVPTGAVAACVNAPGPNDWNCSAANAGFAASNGVSGAVTVTNGNTITAGAPGYYDSGINLTSYSAADAAGGATSVTN